MSWRYIVTRERDEDEDEYVYSIREYYERIPGSKGAGWTVDSIKPVAESYADLKWTLETMLEDAATGAVLDLTLDPPQVVRAEDLDDPEA